MKFLWHDMAWAGYVEWQKDKKTLKRINNLLKDIDRNGYNCIGKPCSIRNLELGIRNEECGTHYGDK